MTGPAHVVGSARELALCPDRTPEQDAAWWLESEPDRVAARNEGLIKWTARMASRWSKAAELGWPHVDVRRWVDACDAAWRRALTSHPEGAPVRSGDQGGRGAGLCGPADDDGRGDCLDRSRPQGAQAAGGDVSVSFATRSAS